VRRPAKDANLQVFRADTTADQNVDNQIREIEAAGFTIDRRRIITETVPGASAIRYSRTRLLPRVSDGKPHTRPGMEDTGPRKKFVSQFRHPRKGFMKLVDRLDEDDVLIVTKMDRLGRNAIDVKSTVDRLTGMHVPVYCLQLGGADLTSAAGKMIMGMLNTFAEFERDLLIERTQSGLARAKASGKRLGRQPVLTPVQRAQVRAKIAAGESVSAVAWCLKTSRMTISRARDGAA
jgi:putative DNA-invertase from lambdoid prophage Rac